jgi:hypothetical protein
MKPCSEILNIHNFIRNILISFSFVHFIHFKMFSHFHNRSSFSGSWSYTKWCLVQYRDASCISSSSSSFLTWMQHFNKDTITMVETIKMPKIFTKIHSFEMSMLPCLRKETEGEILKFYKMNVNVTGCYHRNHEPALE